LGLVLSKEMAKDVVLSASLMALCGCYRHAHHPEHEQILPVPVHKPKTF